VSVSVGVYVSVDGGTAVSVLVGVSVGVYVSGGTTVFVSVGVSVGVAHEPVGVGVQVVVQVDV
jgi:hypothetical protein